jgi:heptosyltransferase-2
MIHSFAIAKKIRGRFEAAIVFPNSLRSVAEAWLAGIPRRVGFGGNFRSMLLTQIIDEPKKKKARSQHQADRYWRLAKHCGAVEPPPLSARSSPAQSGVEPKKMEVRSLIWSRA